jgi:hypothetical protein
MSSQQRITDCTRGHLSVAQDEMGQYGKDRLTACALNAPNGEPTQANASIVGMAGQRVTSAGRCVLELKAQGEDESQDELEERLGVVEELAVGGLIVEIDGESAILAGCFVGLCHVSSPLRWS